MGSQVESKIPGLFGHKWFCPDDQAIAAYVDGMLGDRKTKIETHLIKCERCRDAVGDVVRAQRDINPLPEPPFDLARKALQFAPDSRRRLTWMWAPVGALGVTAIMVVTFLHQPPQIRMPSWSAPEAPTIAKSNVPTTPSVPGTDLVRKSPGNDQSPTVLSPQPDSVVASPKLAFSWKPVPNAHLYSVHLVASDGSPVWEGQTQHLSLRLPAQVTLKGGSYFVWVAAELDQGRTAKSPPVSFLVKR